MNVFAHSKMQFNVRGRVLRLVLIKGGGRSALCLDGAVFSPASAIGRSIGLLVYPASHILCLLLYFK